MICRGVKKTGEPCRRETQIDSDYCYSHGPLFRQRLLDKRNKIIDRQQHINSKIETARKEYYGSWYEMV